MSKCSFICKETLPTGTYIGNFCQLDEDPPRNGRILVENYDTEAKVDALLDLGDIIRLGGRIAPPEGIEHSRKHPCENVCLAYARDVDGVLLPPTHLSLQEFYTETDCEYMYVFSQDGKWRYFKRGDSDLSHLPTIQEFKLFYWADGYYAPVTFDDILRGLPDYDNNKGENRNEKQ